ncbi:MAG: replicative DNA helicase [Chitinophagales bacterium]|nr:replicative DNA helicase [Chitinophagales bacterium]
MSDLSQPLKKTFNLAAKRREPADLSQLMFGKIPPQARDLEEAVLGALMLEKNAVSEVIDILKAESFYVYAHQLIYRAIFTLFGKSQPVDLLTVTEELKRMGSLEDAGGQYYLMGLTNSVASAANVEHHARIISQKYIQRELITISSEIIKDSYDDTTDVFELLDKAEKNLFAVADQNISRNYASMSNLITKAIQQIEELRTHDEKLTGIPSGFTALDRLTGGWQRSDLIIMAARPGMGKTAFVLSIARNAAVDFKKPVAVFSLEMSSLQLVNRLISGEAEIPSEKLRKGNLEAWEWEQLTRKVDKISEAPIFIDDTPAINIFELRAKCRRLKMQHDIQMIIIDYLQLMSGGSDNRSGGNREQEISAISRGLKSIAKELNIPVIALSQLSRAVETRGGDKRPQLSDLRESGAIEQDADLVVFLYRPEYYGMTEDENGNSTVGIGEVIIAKHRNGALDTVKTKFIGKFAKFADLETDSFEDLRHSDARPEIENPGFRTLGSRMDSLDEEAPF